MTIVIVALQEPYLLICSFDPVCNGGMFCINRGTLNRGSEMTKEIDKRGFDDVRMTDDDNRLAFILLKNTIEGQLCAY